MPPVQQAPHAGRVDTQDRLWFAEYRGDAIGLLDPRPRKSRNGSW
jgi:streptogramin lyase